LDVSSTVEARNDIAVVGGAAPVTFGMLASAVSVRALSDSLYKFKTRAAFREVICNAYDAHVVAGIDKPIEITSTPEQVAAMSYEEKLATAAKLIKAGLSQRLVAPAMKMDRESMANNLKKAGLI